MGLIPGPVLPQRRKTLEVFVDPHLHPLEWMGLLVELFGFYFLFYFFESSVVDLEPAARSSCIQSIGKH
jgi:hypothetical protein